MAEPQPSADGNDQGSTNGIDNIQNAKTSNSWVKKTCKEAPPRKSYSMYSHGKPSTEGQSLLSYVLGPDKVPTAFTDGQHLWNDTPQVISYYFMDGTSEQHQKVRNAIDEWTWYANVEFKEATLADQSNVRIRFDPNDGSWSYLGRQCNTVASNEATMNLAWVDQDSSLTSNERAVILHEFGHALGLLHEHRSPAHGGPAVNNISAALELYKNNQGWSTEQIFDQVIEVYNKSDITNYAEVDTSSIMNFPQPKELTGLDHDIGYNERLTELDKAYMILQYPREQMHPRAEAEGWSIEKALDVVGTPADLKYDIMKCTKKDRDSSTGEISAVNIRTAIRKWCLLNYNATKHDLPSAGTDTSRTIQKDRQPTYDSASLNRLMPTFENTEVRKQRERMRKWLLAETKPGNAAYVTDDNLTIPGPDDGKAKNLSDSTCPHDQTLNEKMTNQAISASVATQATEGVKNAQSEQPPRRMTRMEYSESLMQAYLNDRQAWEARRDEMIQKAQDTLTSDKKAIDTMTRRLAHLSAIEDAKLESKHADAVARGYSHTIRSQLGHLDIKSPAELLQDAKDAIRESAISSLYEPASVYPVAMHPEDWFQSLDTGFTQEELSQNPELINAAIKSKQELITRLENQIANLRGFSEGDPEAAKLAMAEAATVENPEKHAVHRI